MIEFEFFVRGIGRECDKYDNLFVRADDVGHAICELHSYRPGVLIIRLLSQRGAEGIKHVEYIG